MLSNEPTLRPGLFRLPDQPVASSILIPSFRAAKRVRGAFGWFSAGWIERLAPGLAEYLNRIDTDPIDFTVAPAWFAQERTAAERGVRMTAQEAAELIVDVFVKGRADASALSRHALDCLAWMIATQTLRLRIAVPTPDSNYHPKIWLFEDGVNRVLARGSGNATDRGVAGGVEHIDVDVSWLPESEPRVRDGVAMLDDWSRGTSRGIEEVVELPEALARDIIRTAPQEVPRPNDYAKAAAGNGAQRQTATPRERRLQIPEHLVWRTGPYAHQSEAVTSWEAGETPETGVIAMATGAGKTLTALICATRSQERLNGKPFLIVVSAPSIPLIMQWRDEVKKFGVNPVAPSLESDTNKALTRLFRGLRGGGTHVAIITNNLLCTPSFQSTVVEKIHSRGRTVPTMLIADEAHTLGAESFVNNKPEFFEKRLALSATPERQYDPDGTEEIFEFFGPPVYEFGLDRAIGFCLVPYKLLRPRELVERGRTRRVRTSSQGGSARRWAQERPKRTPALQRPADHARRRIIETGQSKIALLREVLTRRRGPRDLDTRSHLRIGKEPGAVRSEIGEAVDGHSRSSGSPVTQDTTRNPKLTRAKSLTRSRSGANQVLLGEEGARRRGRHPEHPRGVHRRLIDGRARVGAAPRTRAAPSTPGKPWAIVHDFRRPASGPDLVQGRRHDGR